MCSLWCDIGKCGCCNGGYRKNYGTKNDTRRLRSGLCYSVDSCIVCFGSDDTSKHNDGSFLLLPSSSQFAECFLAAMVPWDTFWPSYIRCLTCFFCRNNMNLTVAPGTPPCQKFGKKYPGVLKGLFCRC